MDGRSTPLAVEHFFVVLSHLERNDGVVIEFGHTAPSQIAQKVGALGGLRGKTVCISLPVTLRGYTGAVFDELVERRGPAVSLIVRCDTTLLATHAARENGAAALYGWKSRKAQPGSGRRRRGRGSGRMDDDMHLASVCCGKR